MNHYMLRRVIAEKVRDYVGSLQQDPQRSYTVFVRKLVLETGCSEKMIRDNLRLYRLSVEDDLVVTV